MLIDVLIQVYNTRQSDIGNKKKKRVQKKNKFLHHKSCIDQKLIPPY